MTTAALPKLLADERRRYLDAAHLAIRLYPGPIGDALADPLFAAAEFGYRLNMGARADRLISALEHELRKRGWT